MYNVTLKHTRGTTVAVEKQYYILWVCVCSLTYTAMRCACAILSPVASPAVRYFSTFSH